MQKAPSPEQITQLLHRWSAGDERALDVLTPLVYTDLKRLARYMFRDQPPGHILQPTAVINEAYLKLAHHANRNWQNRAHFFAVCARAMRQVLVDQYRIEHRAKRNAVIVRLEDLGEIAAGPVKEYLEIDFMLDRFTLVRPRAARVVELRVFGGLSNQEIADVLQISANTVMKDWNIAKAWFGRTMNIDAHERGTKRRAG
jgi:RNA polymerase sigma factor (TIGR02999 family)